MTDLDDIAKNPKVLLAAYAQGYFPMADGRDDDEYYFVKPKQRCMLPIKDIHISRRLKRILINQKFQVAFNKDFPAVIKGCGNPRQKQADTWINSDIELAFIKLHELGYAHSVEIYEGGQLAGGLYGLSMGAAFFGESMFHRSRDASKVALCHLAARLHFAGYDFLDAQIYNPHLEQFGSYLISEQEYESQLQVALKKEVGFLNNFSPDEMNEFLHFKYSML